MAQRGLSQKTVAFGPVIHAEHTETVNIRIERQEPPDCCLPDLISVAHSSSLPAVASRSSNLCDCPLSTTMYVSRTPMASAMSASLSRLGLDLPRSMSETAAWLTPRR